MNEFKNLSRKLRLRRIPSPSRHHQVPEPPAQLTADLLLRHVSELHTQYQVVERIGDVRAGTGVAAQRFLAGALQLLPALVLLERTGYQSGILDGGNQIVVTACLAVDAKERARPARQDVVDDLVLVTDDGYLNVTLTQRERVVRFHSGGNGYYADESGFVFPLQKGFSSRVPIVDGNVPMNIARGYKGEPSTDKEKQWLSSLLALLNYIESSKTWSNNFSQITVLQGGDLLLVPREGKEKFIFGNLSGIDSKFARMKEYYEVIAPSKEVGYYSSVDLRYEGQIVCRK